ncbi:MAG: hypothetical protein CXT73_04050 [Methanobacteriota archaeon]|nr:MAG: hypothetical protein CXT73_04050 [Euryarchaeota archaeon]
MLTNKIDLLYFTNSKARKTIHNNEEKKENKEISINKKDVKFYRKRILQLTKDLLRGTESSIIIKESFNAYINTAIKSFKFEDETEILQEEFKDLEEKKEKDKSNKEFKSIESDKLMMKDLKNKKKDNIKNFAIVKIKKKQENIKTPTQKKIDLKTEKLKNKGVKKKKKKKI